MQRHRLYGAARQHQVGGFALSRQMAPKLSVEAMRKSRGAEECVPRFAHWRLILFLWPTRASPANQTSSG
jgi:hypothetical protein